MILKIASLIFAVSTFTAVQGRIYITEVINKTYQVVQLVYPNDYGINIKVITSKSIKTGEYQAAEVKSVYNNTLKNTAIVLPSGTITTLENAFIPNEGYGDAKSGIHVGFGTWVKTFNLQGPGGGDNVFALIYQKGNFIELTPVKQNDIKYSKRVRLTKENLAEGEKYILEIDEPDKVSLYPGTKEAIAQYSNPSNLQPQEWLHQAIVNDSVDDIKAAIKSGANIELGLGQQPPLLLAVIMEKQKAIETLLNLGANPNIEYLNQPLLFYIIKKNDYRLAQLYLNYGVGLSELQKKELADYIMFHSPYRFDQIAIDILKLLNYDIKDNFRNPDLLKNKWYQLLVKHSAGTSHGKPVGHMGLPALDLVILFLKNGADPNQIFYVSQTGATWTPLLLIMDSYVGLESKRCNPDVMRSLVKALVDSGADINLKALCIPGKKEASPLSYLLLYDNTNCVIDILIEYKASIDMAIQLFLNNGGSVNKTFRFWQISGSWNLLSLAIENNNPQSVRLLVKAGANKDQAMLKLAISKGYSEIINILISKE